MGSRKQDKNVKGDPRITFVYHNLGSLAFIMVFFIIQF